MATITQGVKGTASVTGANLGFTLGLESSLASITSAVDGLFYLTSDTHRLFIGDKDGHLSPVNQGVISVDNVASLPTTGEQGQFYYAEAENILCVRSGSQWVQINPNTYLNEFTNSVAGITNGAKVTTGGKLSNGNIVTKVGNFNIVGDGTEVKVTNSGTDTVSITGAKYTLNNTISETNGKVTEAYSTLKRDGTKVSDTFSIIPGSNITFEKNAEGKLVIKADDQASGAKITSFVASNNGSSSTPSNGFHFVITDGSKKQYQTDIQPIIEYGGGSTKSTINFVDGKATLDIYTKDEIDNTVLSNFQKTVNAMTYKGVVDAKNGPIRTLPTTNVQIGDVWMMTTSEVGGEVFPGSGDTTKYQSGTLAIAQGTEGSDGYITSSTLNWVIVQNFNTDTQYTFKGTTSDKSGTWTVTQKQGPTTSTAGTLVIGTSGNTPIDVAATEKNGTLTIQIDHKAQTVTRNDDIPVWSGSSTTPATDLFVGNVITQINTNTTGHITSVETKTISIKNPTLEGSSSTTNTTDKKSAKRTHTLKLKNGNAVISAVTAETTVKSDSLEVVADNGAIKIDMVWGHF